jgi:hypothetical protein
MAERLNNDFQFIEVGRKDPKKKLLRQRKKSSWKSTNRSNPSSPWTRPTAAWVAATRIANGSARCTTSFPTG